MLCPRCGLPGTRSIERRSGRDYIYYVHVLARGRRVKHYVGPAEQYEYVEKLHQLNLRNIAEVDYIDVVLRALSKYVELRRSSNSRQELVEGLRRVVKFCEEKIRELEAEHNAEHNQAKNS